MNIFKKIGGCFLMGALLFSCQNQSSTDKKVKDLRDKIEDDLLTNILPFWMKYSIDTERGGFHGFLNYNGEPDTTYEKGGVLNARIMWTFSEAYRLFQKEEYKEMADRAQRYFLDHFIDTVNGGVYWSIKPNGMPYDETPKQTYVMAYAIYGLAEHYRAFGNEESLEAAKKLFRIMEDKIRDSVNDGYIETYTLDLKKIDLQEYNGYKMPSKTMNTHIHVLEAYANLYKVWKDEELKNRLRTSIHLVMDTIYNEKTHHLKLYFDEEWNSLGDIDSYGHDIETAWLAVEAAKSLGEKELLNEVKEKAIAMVDVFLTEGLEDNGAVIYERENEKYQKNSQWWCEAEAINGCIDAYQNTGDAKYVDAACKIWNFIEQHMIDKTYGEWHGYITEDGSCRKEDPKASLWRCPYHNSRMGFEMYERFK